MILYIQWIFFTMCRTVGLFSERLSVFWQAAARGEDGHDHPLRDGDVMDARRVTERDARWKTPWAGGTF